jgi:hypothetical protein
MNTVNFKRRKDMVMNKRYIRILAALFIGTMLILPLTGCGKSKTVESGATWTVTETTKLSSLTVADGASVKAPEGYSVTLTVDGVETGQVLEKWTAKDYKFAPGSYKGDIVLTVAKANNVSRGGMGGGMPGAAAEGAAGAGAPGGAAPAAGGAPGAGAPGGQGAAPAAGGAPGAGAPGGAAPGGAAPGAPAAGAPGGQAAAPGGAAAGGAPGGGSGVATTRVGGDYSFRQALYLDKNGIDESKSVLAAVKGEKPTGFEIKDIEIKSNGSFYKDATSPGGTGFTGIYAAGGEYNIKNVKIDFFGDGLNDFIGYGAGIVTSGKGTKLVLDNVTINNKGVVRAGVIAKEGSKVIVKNSKIQALNGVLPPDDPWGQSGQMRSTLWISGMSGTTRATSVLGTETEATYINSSITSEGWGVLSTDGTNNVHLTAINCKVAQTGPEGYGTYNDPSAHVAFYGTDFNIATFAAAIGSGDLYYGDSTPEAVAAVNEKLGLGLTDEELKSIPNKATVINSKKYGVMWHARSGNPLTVDGGTIFNTPKTTFIVSGVAAVLNVNGSGGAQINPGNGIIMQVMSDDEPTGGMMGQGDSSFEEPTTAPEPIKGFDNTSPTEAATANFSNINLNGNFYNSIGWAKLTDKLNMAINLDKSSITGVISASESHHPSPKITKANQTEFHSITDTVRPAVNNGVIVNLTNGSTWTVTGTSYITSLTIADGSAVTAPEGSKVTMTVNGVKKEIKAGKYSGKITLTLN